MTTKSIPAHIAAAELAKAKAAQVPVQLPLQIEDFRLIMPPNPDRLEQTNIERDFGAAQPTQRRRQPYCAFSDPNWESDWPAMFGY